MKIDGQIACWRYRQARSGYRGFHTSADAAGAMSMSRALTHLSAGQELTIPLVPLTLAILSVPNNSRDHAVGYSRLTLRAVVGDAVQRFVDAHPVLTLEASGDRRDALAEAYRSVAAGEGDFTTGPEEHNLWFWWWHNG
jgi:hypothetical protein